MPKDRGAEQGDVDGPLECSLALGMVAAETRGRAAQQASGSLTWIGVDDLPETQRLQAEHAAKMLRISNAQWVNKGSPELKTRGMLCKKMEAWRTWST